MTFRFLALGTAALALSACSIPNFTTPEVATFNAAPKPVAAAPKQVATVKTPAPASAPQQVAAQTQTAEASKPAKPLGAPADRQHG